MIGIGLSIPACVALANDGACDTNLHSFNRTTAGVLQKGTSRGSDDRVREPYLRPESSIKFRQCCTALIRSTRVIVIIVSVPTTIGQMESISETIENRSRNPVTRGWITPSQNKRLRWTVVLQVLGRNLRNYCESSSLVGYRYLAEPHRAWFERVIWIVLHATTLCILGLIVHSAYVEYLQVPVVTVVDSDNYPSHKLEFPGIAICNINRISRKAAIELANGIIEANITDLSFVDVLNLIQQFGALYDSSGQQNETSEKFLDQLLKDYYSEDYDVTSIMKNLSPSCTDGLSSCHFQGEAKNCSDIFVFRKTQDGFCCTFNYVRESDDISTTEEIKEAATGQPYNISSLGITNGLSLVMEPFVEDYYYPMLPITGWKITVFNSHDYPDNGSGSVSEALLSPATETFVELDVTSFYSSDEIRAIRLDKRKCIFQDELPVLYTGYTYSDCLVDCRAAAIWDTCQCRPFYLPRRGNDQYTRKVCNTGDSACLHKYKEVYWTVLADKVDDPDEKRYKLPPETAQRCSTCFPACNDVRYYLHSSTTYLDRGVYHTELINNVRLDNQSIVHIYFTKHGSIRLKQEVAYYWYELLSNIGGICGVFIGFSLISVVEFFYFVFCTLREFCRGDKKSTPERTTLGGTRNSKRRRGRENEKPFTGTLYWNEFLAHSRVTKHDSRIRRMQVQRY